MEGDQRFTQPHQERPTLRGIYFTVLRPSLAEFWGVFFLTFGLYSSSALLEAEKPPQPQPGGDPGGFVGTIAVVFLYIGIYSITRSISGGHLNPIITLIQMGRKATFPLVGVCYLGAHLLGAVLGALSVEAITEVSPASQSLKPFFGTGHAIFGEMIGTAIVILAYLTLANQSKGNTAILGIGFGYAGALLAVHSAASGYLNPVLNFGIAVASGTWTKHYVYWVGTALGGIIATILHGLIFASDDQLWIKSRNYVPERIA
ncbi:probable aquaporin TIP-type [Paramuricea clavata]|uniref:Probable aquaporin TIP-type n=1 Tax=Paramuricea clavata TaxID=317549 RepID=A0A6S7FTR0_PARCT|nr:probable aquaporin TIP-type [Paramuricea clavata]